MLKMQDVTVRYDDKIVLEHFCCSIKQGEIVSLVGESGSGKTTVIRAILGLLSGNGKITEGDILLEENSLLKMTEKEMQKFRGKRIAMIFQDSSAVLNPIRTIGSQFVEYLRYHEKIGEKEAWKRSIEMLEMMHLADVENIMKSYPFQLSGGMCQRVGIAMAMSLRPMLLLADEPTSALDVTTQSQIVKQMMEINRKYQTGIVMVTHNLGVAAYMSDKIIVMRDGKIIEEGNREQILHHSVNEYTRSLLGAIPTMDGERYVG